MTTLFMPFFDQYFISYYNHAEGVMKVGPESTLMNSFTKGQFYPWC